MDQMLAITESLHSIMPTLMLTLHGLPMRYPTQTDVAIVMMDETPLNGNIYIEYFISNKNINISDISNIERIQTSSY
jgi:hypothetical protein